MAGLPGRERELLQISTCIVLIQIVPRRCTDFDDDDCGGDVVVYILQRTFSMSDDGSASVVVAVVVCLAYLVLLPQTAHT